MGCRSTTSRRSACWTRASYDIKPGPSDRPRTQAVRDNSRVHAIMLRAFGPPSVLRLEEVEDPQPGPGHVLLGVHLANVTFVETQIRAGKAPRVEMLPKLPVILGNGVGGTVIAAADADKSMVGRGVIASLNGTGGYAERAVADASGL